MNEGSHWLARKAQHNSDLPCNFHEPRLERLAEQRGARHRPGVSDLPCDIRREGGRSLVLLEGREGNPL